MLAHPTRRPLLDYPFRFVVESAHQKEAPKDTGASRLASVGRCAHPRLRAQWPDSGAAGQHAIDGHQQGRDSLEALPRRTECEDPDRLPRRLVRQQKSRTSLIVENLRMHHAKPVEE